MDYEKIIDALTLIRDTCAETTCNVCPFRISGDECGIRDEDPEWWKIKDSVEWRAFK